MLIQIAQRAEDLTRASAFYESLLGVPPTAQFDPPGLLFFDLGGVRLLLEGGAPTAVHYFGVSDLDAQSRRPAVAGGHRRVRAAPHLRAHRRHPGPRGQRGVAGVHPRLGGQPGRPRRDARHRWVLSGPRSVLDVRREPAVDSGERAGPGLGTRQEHVVPGVGDADVGHVPAECRASIAGSARRRARCRWCGRPRPSRAGSTSVRWPRTSAGNGRSSPACSSSCPRRTAASHPA